ncbi:iron-sulfur cluster assembly protein [Natrinema soli]|uniref:Iron-sulfur cluster assembly protein n=1 Tax=Natrinema soli TaxID=1930624 RepID=A0ABD5SNW8_9EURY|nr:iron-sulfur cluster assembly protein [Natrinema soli]
MSIDNSRNTPPSISDVRKRLDNVTDPELDESIVALDYISEIVVQGTTVDVSFMLPTAWCSPAFAWMMATDARDEVESLPGVDQASIVLREHMHETEITEGVNARRSFGEVFPDADGSVADIRATLDSKARLARQYEALNELLDAGVTAEQIVALEYGDLSFDDGVAVTVQDRSVEIPVSADPLESYVEKARATGLIDDDCDVLFRTPEGEPIEPEQFDLIHKRARLARVNMTGQGGVCDALNEARWSSN